MVPSPPTRPVHARAWRVALAAGGCAAVLLVHLAAHRLGLSSANVAMVPVAATAWVAGAPAALPAALFAAALSWSVGQPHDWLVGLVVPGALCVATAGVIGSLRIAYDRERALARTDAVTNAPNRRAFEEGARSLLRAHARLGRPLTAVIIDLDGFKTVNDTLGHDEGDEVLRLVARTLAATIRGTDVVARYGGDEFALILADTDARGALALLARVRDALDAEMRGRRWPVTFSIGALTFERPPRSERELVKLVDAQMYAAKNAGKDRIFHAVYAPG